jgi:hypothetical protein
MSELLKDRSSSRLVAAHRALRAAVQTSVVKVEAQLNRKGDRADGSALVSALSDVPLLRELIQPMDGADVAALVAAPRPRLARASSTSASSSAASAPPPSRR